MAAVTLEAKKAKLARRVVEVLEFLGDRGEAATVMEFARHYGRPQSSTSELLQSLVSMGVLYKDPATRAFSPTPRLATIGTGGQPDFIRNGRLFGYMDTLARTSRKTVALFGIVGTHVQAFRWLPASRQNHAEVGSGSSELLSSSVAGLLLLSTFQRSQARGLLWRLHAEAPEHAKFNFAETLERVEQYRRQGHAIGAAGFVPREQMSAVLLPRKIGERPLALGIVSAMEGAREADALIDTLKHGLQQALAKETDDPAPAMPFLRAV
jgi:DNA-binding IclR family transcriptional regulator